MVNVIIYPYNSNNQWPCQSLKTPHPLVIPKLQRTLPSVWRVINRANEGIHVTIFVMRGYICLTNFAR